MASVPYAHELAVPAPRAEAFSWWTNFTVEDHAGERHLRGVRTDLRREGNVWTWADTYVALGLRTRWVWRVLVSPPDREELHGVTNLGTIHGVITFEEEAGGTRVRERGTFSARRLGNLLLPFLKRRLNQLLETDFREHWAEFAREREPIGRAPPTEPPLS